MSSRILIGDCLEELAGLPAESVHCCITSPPYYGLRDYGVEGAIGLEATPEEHIAKLVEVFREVGRVLRKDGTLWLNYGDAYAGSCSGNSMRPQGGSQRSGAPGFQPLDKRYPARDGAVPAGLKPKDLLMMPARLALALQADGWWLRSMMPWVKRSAMPESVTDRPATAIEYVFLLAKSSRYFFDMEAVRIKSEWGGVTKKPDGWATHDGGHGSFHRDGREKGAASEVNGGSRNFRNSDLFYASLEPPHGLICGDDPLALDVNPAGFSESHFATFPPKLVEPLIKAGTSEKGVCGACGAPWVRELSEARGGQIGKSWVTHEDDLSFGKSGTANMGQKSWESYEGRKPIGWSPSCACDAAAVAATVLDPFGGAGTVALVADRLGRDAVLIELNPEYAEMARRRIEGDAGLFAEVGP